MIRVYSNFFLDSTSAINCYICSEELDYKACFDPFGVSAKDPYCSVCGKIQYMNRDKPGIVRDVRAIKGLFC